MTSKGNTLLFHDGKGEVFEEDSGAIFYTEVLNCKHRGWFLPEIQNETMVLCYRGWISGIDIVKSRNLLEGVFHEYDM